MKFTIPSAFAKAKPEVRAAPETHVIPLARMAPAELQKAFSRGPLSHKYLKRERAFVSGKLTWRYWYADDLLRQQGKAQHDPEEKHEHRLISEEKTVHPHLKEKVIAAIEATLARIGSFFGWSKQPSEVHVSASPGWSTRIHAPFVANEQAGKEPEKNPQGRLQRAAELLPDHIKELIGEKHGSVPALREVKLTTNSEDEIGSRVLGLGGYTRRTADFVVVTDGMLGSATGADKYNSPKTLAEVVLWHELGHRIHYALEEVAPKAIEEWQALHRSNDSRISGYASSSWMEDFAESHACMLAYPQQMARECPDRYDWMQKNVHQQLPTRDVVLRMPPEEFAWWETKPQTPAGRVLSQLKVQEPAKRFAPYYSEKDQFYTVSRKGRVAYFRFGPPDKLSEEGWSRMPATLDPETGLPRYEGGKFDFRGQIKEIYDQNGTPLTDRQAYFYLGQDDDPEDKKGAVQAALSGGTDPAKYLEWAHEKKNDTHALGYKMYSALGQSKSEATLTKERERVAEERAKGATGYRERHDWVPVEVTRDEFVQKSGTFKFGEMRESPALANPLYEMHEGKRVSRKAYDPVAGQWRPLVSSRVYEQRNPDGTYARFRVAEAAPFSVGAVINAPQEVEREIAGEKRRVVAWLPYTVQEGDPLDPDELARKFKVSGRTLLEANNTYGRFKLMDPVVGALLDPEMQHEIRNEADLQALMRNAAEADPPRRAWVSLSGGGDVRTSPVAHIQVEWDGAGPPLVVGDYWARKLGKSSIRLDELLDKNDEIRLPRIAERSPKMRKVEPGKPVWITDPQTRKRVMAVYIRTVEQDGKKVHQVQPLSGQGARIAKRLIVVDEVRPTSESEIPGKADRRRRFVEPLEHDLLLYMDEIDPASGPTAPGGVVKIQLPKDGSINHEQLIRAHGVRPLPPDPDQALGSYQIALRDIPRFRESIGGFVMEPRVRATLDQEIRDERVRLEKGRALDHLVKYEDIEDQYGNINPDGVLKGLVPGDAGIQPGSWRVKALQKLANSGGRLFAAHHMGTGKTALAIMADQMMRNLNDAAGRPHANQVRGKTAYLVPANKPADWYEEIKKFGGETPTLLGASTLANALQVPELPERKPGEKDESYKVRAMAAWKERLATETNLWNPFADPSKRIVVGHEYFRDHEEALRLTGLFDGMVIDEAHKMVREDNLLSRAIGRWSPNMKLFLPMSGTPVRNRLDVIPRIVELVSGGQVRLGSKEAFEERYLLPSAILKALGVRNPPRTDLNPTRAAELMNIIGPYIDVATAADVKSKMMPAIAIDENSPAHMIGQQARMYRAQMNKLTSKDRVALQQSALGIDEQGLLSDDAKRYVAAARNTANCPAYKVPDERESLTYEAQIVQFDKQGKPSGVTTAEREFRLPTYETMVGKGPQGWRGKWPSPADVESRRVDPGYYHALSERFEHLMGVTYDSVMGKPIDKDVLDAVSKGSYVTPTGQEWNARVVNSDYGPEGMVSRGVVDETTGRIGSVPFVFYDEHGAAKRGDVPVGTRFIRDPRRKGSALYFHEKDWDFTGRFDTSVEGGTEGGDTGEVEEVAEGKPKKGKAREQQPLAGQEEHDVNRSPARRVERAMFDAVVTHGNAKADALEEWMLNTLSTKTGVPNPENAQFILFGNRLGSSVRTLESKMRTMGFQDVNEALGHSEWSSDADKQRRPRKYFVSFLSKGGTLGDRDLNSEVFRRKQDQFGNPTGPSMLVWRTLYGTTGSPPKAGEIKEGWTRKQRANIAAAFVDGYGAHEKSGKPSGLVVPMRVMGVAAEDGTVSMQYLYEADLEPASSRRVKELEGLIRGSLDAKKTAEYQKEMRALFEPHWTKRMPLTDHQQYVFNNCQTMIASDAAAVGMNWTAGHLAMYDSLFSPMDEAQRIARAARQLPPAFARQIRPVVDKIQAWIKNNETSPDNERVRFDPLSAMEVVNKAIDSLTEGERTLLADAPGGKPDQLVEAIFATRALDRVQSLMKPIGDELRTTGFAPEPTQPAGDGNWIPREGVTDQDVKSFIVRTELTPFERSMMKARPYLVDVKRFTTSVDVPVMKKVRVRDPASGATIIVEVEVTDEQGNPVFKVESPNEAERAQLAQARAKAVGFEDFIKQVQNAQPITTPYDFVSSNVGSFGAFGTLDPTRLTTEGAGKHDESIHYDTELVAKKSEQPVRFVVHPPARPRFVIRGNVRIG